MLDEYLALGGVELGNNARALAYSRCLSCCAGLLKGGACDGIHDATNAFADAEREWVEQARNLFTNPNLVGSGTWAEVRRNRSSRPVASAFWGTNGGAGSTVSTVDDTRFSGGKARRIAFTDTVSWFTNSASNIPMLVGERWLVSFRAEAVGATVLTPAIGGGLGVASSVVSSGEVAHADGTKTVWAVREVTAAGTGIPIISGGGSPGGVVLVGEALHEKVPGFAAYFDGSTKPAGLVQPEDFRTRWLGEEGASESVLEIETVQGLTASNAVAGVSTKAGKPAVRLIPTGTSTDTFGQFTIPTPARSGGTFIATRHQDGFVSTPHTSGRQVAVYTSSTAYRSGAGPNVAGSAPLRLSYPSLTDYFAARLYHGGAQGSGDVWWTDIGLFAGVYNGGWFSGDSLPAGAGDDFRVSWAGAENASASVLERNVVTVPSQSLEPPYTCNDIQRAPWYDPDNEFSQDLAGFYLLRVTGITDSTATATVTQGIDDGGVIGASRHATRSVRVRSMIIGCGNAAAEYGLAWLKAALSETFCARHGDACGTSDLAFFIDCPPALDPGDTDYAATTARYRRYLHGVGMTSGPIIAEEYETASGAYVIVVEYILTAESPFVWGETLPVASTGDVLTAYDDIPFNLMRHPNAEVGDGIPAVTATQYVFNGSVEYGATGWANSVSNIPAGITAGASTDIAAVGPNSYRVRLLATGAVSGGVINAYYDVALGSMPAGSKPSLSLWAAALIFAGAPTLDPNLAASVEWRNGATVVGTTPLGDIPLNGGNATATGLTIPATATTARIRVRASNITAAAADDLRLYADAFSLTVP
ncbi:minor tail protein [Microbacterium phage Jayden]|uniref:Minor tail protein n=1 Tax=Microbacterium phage Jayden TaxID=2656550 RepID=A0A649VSG9_9CAUD|nr:minor tail protein [Microbacterium phage Jayden]QGJ95258.1 minor tail protein [Microbacterium phage Jayden]